MKVLIIGGTRFVGRHITNILCERGHDVTHFNRGLSPARAGVETLRGDRASEIARVGSGHWDAVIDMCGYTPTSVERSTRHFSGRAGRYVFFSSVSVYDFERTTAPDEDAPVLRLPDGADKSVFSLEQYGALKALCEAVVLSTFRQRATILRPTLIVGPYDPTDRFTYWPVRFEAGGEILTPEAAHAIQYIDARDLAAFCVRVVEEDVSGIYNCATPPGMIFGDVFSACAASSAAPASLHHASDEFLLAHEVAPWMDLPLWVPRTSEYAGIANANSKRALIQGLTFRTPRETVRDTLAWAIRAGKRFGTLQAGLSPARELTILNDREP